MTFPEIFTKTPTYSNIFRYHSGYCFNNLVSIFFGSKFKEERGNT